MARAAHQWPQRGTRNARKNFEEMDAYREIRMSSTKRSDLSVVLSDPLDEGIA